jgi:hypothetical protein
MNLTDKDKKKSVLDLNIMKCSHLPEWNLSRRYVSEIRMLIKSLMDIGKDLSYVWTVSAHMKTY